MLYNLKTKYTPYGVYPTKIRRIYETEVRLSMSYTQCRALN